MRVCVSVYVCACAPGRRWAWGAPRSNHCRTPPPPPNPCAPAVSVPVPVPVPGPPRTPLRLPAVNTPLPQVNCAALCKAIQTRSGRSPSRPTGTTSCPDRGTGRSGSGTPHRVCLHIRRRAYVACPVSVSVSREFTSPLVPAQGCRTVGACLSVGACACLCMSARARRGGGGRGARLDPTIAEPPPPPNPCAPAVSVPVPVPVPVPPRTPLRLPAVNTPLPQVNCAALCKAIQTRSRRSPSRPTGTTSCPDRMTRRSGSGTPHRVCLHIRRRAYVACPVSRSVRRHSGLRRAVLRNAAPQAGTGPAADQHHYAARQSTTCSCTLHTRKRTHTRRPRVVQARRRPLRKRRRRRPRQVRVLVVLECTRPHTPPPSPVPGVPKTEGGFSFFVLRPRQCDTTGPRPGKRRRCAVGPTSRWAGALRCRAWHVSSGRCLNTPSTAALPCPAGLVRLLFRPGTAAWAPAMHGWCLWGGNHNDESARATQRRVGGSQGSGAAIFRSGAFPGQRARRSCRGSASARRLLLARFARMGRTPPPPQHVMVRPAPFVPTRGADNPPTIRAHARLSGNTNQHTHVAFVAILNKAMTLGGGGGGSPLSRLRILSRVDSEIVGWHSHRSAADGSDGGSHAGRGGCPGRLRGIR